jgi:hypothetical protein
MNPFSTKKTEALNSSAAEWFIGSVVRIGSWVILIAKTAWLEAARSTRKSIPRPRYRPMIYHIAA